MDPKNRARMRIALPFLLAALAAVTSPVQADEAAGSAPAGPSVAGVPLSGRIYADLYAPMKNVDTNTFNYVGTSFWLQADPKLGDKGSARVILESDAIETSASGRIFRTYVREGYVTLTEPGWEVRVGRQIIPWGKADVINPTDLISAKDYTVFNPDEEVRRAGQTSVLLNFTPQKGSSPLTLTGILTPAFAPSTLLFNPSLVPAGVTLLGTPTFPALTVPNAEEAFKAAYVGSGWDISAMYFRGFNHLPEFYSVNPGVVGQTFSRITATGGDASFTWDKYVIRAETAYVWTPNDDGTNPTIQPTHWDTVVGVERAFASDFRLQVQGVYRYIPHFTPPDQATGPNPLQTAINRQIAASNALILNYQNKTRTGVTARFGYLNDQNGIDAEVFFLGYFDAGDYLIRPKLAYAWTDASKTTIGIDWYGGPLDRPLGQLSVYNSLFLEAKYSF